MRGRGEAKAVGLHGLLERPLSGKREKVRGSILSANLTSM